MLHEDILYMPYCKYTSNLNILVMCTAKHNNFICDFLKISLAETYENNNSNISFFLQTFIHLAGIFILMNMYNIVFILITEMDCIMMTCLE